MKLKTIGIKAQDQELALERRMVLSAPNGSGKSTFADAIRFLALGYVPSLGKRPQDTAALLREPLMAAILTLSDGRVIGRSLEETDDGYRTRAECSWLEGSGVHRHAAEILSLFGRDEQDVAEALDIRQLLQATPQQREARIAGLLSASRASPAEKSARLRRLFQERHPPAAGSREAPTWDDLTRTMPLFAREALAAAARHLEELLRETDPAGLLAWVGEERRRAAARLLQKTKAREELEARLAPRPEADEARIRRLEEERERLERDLGALEEKALQIRLREETLERLRRERDAGRVARDEAAAERKRWEARALDLASVPEELMAVEHELDELVPPSFQEPAAAADAAARAAARRREAEEIALPDVPDPTAAEQRLREREEELARAAASPWTEVAAIAESLRDLARAHLGSAMVQTLVHAQRLSQLARQTLREDAAELRRRLEDDRKRVTRRRREFEEREAERAEAAARRESLLAEARAAEEEADLLRRQTRDDHARAFAEFEERRHGLLRERDRLRRSLQALTADDRRTSSARDRTQLRLESLDRELSAALGPIAADDLPEAELHRKLHDVRRELAELGALQAARLELDRVAEEEARAHAARDVHSALERALQRLQEEEIMESRDRLGGLLESMLRAAGRTEVPFFVAARGACRIGWRTPAGKEIPVQSLSGGEWILFAAVLTAAILILRNAPLRMLIVEAGEADAHTLQTLLDAIGSVSDRLTCAMVLTPRAVHAPGWTVVKRFGPPVVQSA